MRAETSMNDLQALAARQQQQLHNQAAIIAAKEQRLRHLQAQIEEGENLAAGSEAASNEAERLRRLREKVEAQEAKLRKLRALRGQVEQQRISNGALSADLTSIRALFNEKEKELSMAAAQVEELTNQLEQLQFQANQAQAHPGTKAYFVHLHLERLRAELMYRNKLNDQKNSELVQRKQQLLENRENISDLDKRISELKDRLQRKKQLNQQLATQLSSTSQKQASKQQLQQRKGPHLQQQNQSQVAAVEPFNRQPPAGPASSNADEDVGDFCASKSDPKYQTLPHNTRFVPLIFNNNNNNNNNSNIAPMLKAVKVASVPPQVSEKPALPPKPAVKPTLPPRQTPEKDIIHHLEELREKRESLQTPALTEKKEQEQKRDNGEIREEAKEPAAPPPPAQPPPSESPAQDDLDDVFGGTEIETQVDDLVTPPAPAEESDESGSSHTVGPSEGIARRLRKGNLKSREANRKSRRVSFDPLALLLDAALEGELELVKKTAVEVSNPSAANDEGITALHNAICAGHLDIVKFLVELGCDVNAQDSDGWTPLHCAASCNNLAMVKFLVDHGACIFAATLSDHETAAEKCEEDEEGFDGCSEYLYSIQEKLGILNSGRVYALFDYDAQNPDELSFKEGDELVVLRKGDDFEREWWWSRLGDQEGYVPRNLLGLNPRIHKQESEH